MVVVVGGVRSAICWDQDSDVGLVCVQRVPGGQGGRSVAVGEWGSEAALGSAEGGLQSCRCEGKVRRCQQRLQMLSFHGVREDK